MLPILIFLIFNTFIMQLDKMGIQFDQEVSRNIHYIINVRMLTANLWDYYNKQCIHFYLLVYQVQRVAYITEIEQVIFLGFQYSTDYIIGDRKANLFLVACLCRCGRSPLLPHFEFAFDLQDSQGIPQILIQLIH